MPRRKTRKPPNDEALQGPPPRELRAEPTAPERRVLEERDEHTDTSPTLSGGDPDADWQRAQSVGEEAVGGSVKTPGQNVVDEIGEALGVPQGPADEVRSTAEILEERDDNRGREEGAHGRDRTKS
jgi:Family of unknown function (DUF6335)